jgi:protein involved in polysaccharide export with SLBB domain
VRSTERRRLRVLLVGTLALAGACATSGGSVGHAPPTATASVDARLGPGDTFEVAVYEEKELSGKYQVAEDGSINFPFIGHVRAAGRTPTELAQDIQSALRDKQLLRNPSVSVFVTEYASKRITVVGAVSKPGAFPLTAGMTAVQAISLAGGFTPLASQNEVVITRKVDGKLMRYKLAVEKISEGRSADMELKPGDLVFVPERLF